MTDENQVSTARAKRNSLFEAQNLSHDMPGVEKAGRYFRWSWPF